MFAENTPTSSYHRSVLEYPAAGPRFEITLEGARADDQRGREATVEHDRRGGRLDLVFKGWFHDPAMQVELLPDGLLLRGPSSVVAIVAPPRPAPR